MKRFLLPAACIIFIVVMFMNSAKPKYELPAYTDLIEVDDQELLDLDLKRAETEGVKLESNYPAFMKKGDVGVLIIHGFTGSPMEMQPLADYLNERGMSTYLVRMAGHASDAKNLNLTTYRDWYESARYGYFLLKRNCKKIFIAGLSMGGLTAINVAGINGADGVILMAPCIRMRSTATKFSPVLSRFVKLLPKLEIGEWSKVKKHMYYDKWPVTGIYQLLMYTQYTQEHMDRFTFPMIGFQFINDGVVSGRATKEFFGMVPSADKTYVEFPDKKLKNHILVSEENMYRDEMFAKIADWIDERGE